jgi:hypothetical protein
MNTLHLQIELFNAARISVVRITAEMYFSSQFYSDPPVKYWDYTYI